MFIQMNAGRRAKARARSDLVNEKQGVEHDRFRESDCENRLHEDRCRRARVAADRGSRAHADQTHADGCAKGREANVNASAYLCQ
jgi:hypothetical protein